MKRRDFLKTAGSVCGACLLPTPTNASPAPESGIEFDAVLVDLFRCNGCRKCEEACAEENGLPIPDIKDKTVFQNRRTTGTTAWTVVNRFETAGGEVFVKNQCMHCNQPGCAAACLVRAMEKTRNGPVTWDASKCMGCRFCMVSCPFDIPKFEYDSPVPKIQKCIMCTKRLGEGRVPACVEGCPVEALTFGKRRDLVELARMRIYSQPDRYVREIYGEKEVGGTSWLYVSPVPFKELGFRTNVGIQAVPEFSQDFLYSVPVILALWPAFLFAASRATAGRSEGKSDGLKLLEGKEEDS
jgi:formate dehydrogenase iron-sulfur subunit